MENKSTKTWVIVVGIVLVFGFLLWYGNKGTTTPVTPEVKPLPQVAVDYKNGTYEIEGDLVTLRNGVFEGSIAGSQSKIVTRYFGNEARADLNGDGLEDVVFLLTQNSGGTGTFYYVVAALKTSLGYKPTNTIFLGDRIAPQTTTIVGGEIAVNFAERLPNEPMSATPSVAVSKYFKVSNGILVEIAKEPKKPAISDLIRVTSPQSGSVVKSPLTLKGEARGGWYFEASFPVRIFDAKGKQLGVIPAQAKGEWMTPEFVPFEAKLIFETPTTKTGTVVFEKDNPSGLPEHDNSLTIPINF